MQNCVLHNLIREFIELGLSRQFTVDQQKRHLKKAGLLSQNFNWDTAVFKDSLITIDITDVAGRAYSVCISWIVYTQWIAFSILDLQQIFCVKKIALS